MFASLLRLGLAKEGVIHSHTDQNRQTHKSGKGRESEREKEREREREHFNFTIPIPSLNSTTRCAEESNTSSTMFESKLKVIRSNSPDLGDPSAPRAVANQSATRKATDGKTIRVPIMMTEERAFEKPKPPKGR